MFRNLFRNILAPLILVALLTLGGYAFAAWTYTNNATAKATQACASGTVPTSVTSDGVALAGLTLYSVVIEADSGQTLSGAGTLTAYLWEPAIAAWMPYPSANIAVPASASGARRVALASTVVPPRRGRIAFVTTGVTVSSGTCTTWILGASGRD